MTCASSSKQAKVKGEYERASRLEYGEIPALEKQLTATSPRESAMLRLEVANPISLPS